MNSYKELEKKYEELKVLLESKGNPVDHKLQLEELNSQLEKFKPEWGEWEAILEKNEPIFKKEEKSWWKQKRDSQLSIDKKEFWVMRIKYTKTPDAVEETKKKAIITDADIKKEEKLQVMGALLRKHNLPLYRDDLGKKVCEVLKKNTLEEYKDIIARLQDRYCNTLISHIGWSKTMNLVVELEKALKVAENELTEELQANIEVK